MSQFLPLLLKFIPPAERGKVEAVFELGRSMRRATRGQGGPVSDVGVFMDMVEQVAVEWRIVAARLLESAKR